MSATRENTVQQDLTIRLLRVLRYNKSRIERCISLLSERKKPLFHAIPFLLHVNNPKLPGYVSGKHVPHGLHNYTLRPDISKALQQTFIHDEKLITAVKKMWPKTRSIESLLLMGSVGTIAQQEDSDFDYWVCIQGERFSDAELRLLQTKLSAIEQWALEQFDVEVHFFISDIGKVQKNDFGIAEGESAGSAQANVLKAEFYSTNIVVAGKAPFWWLTPEGSNNTTYTALHGQLATGESIDPDWLMDLGNIERIEPREIFGAAIWQLSKAMDSPFKSLLKMAKLEVTLAKSGPRQLVCNVLKNHVYRTDETAIQFEAADPYALMFDHVVAYYEHIGEIDIVHLLRQCLYIKCNAQLSVPVDLLTSNFKHRLMTTYVKKWGWTNAEIRALDHRNNWSFGEQAALSKKIHGFLIKCYRRISSKLAKYNQTVDQTDMTVLGRRLATFYSRETHKVDYLRSSFGNELYCETITIKSQAGKDHKNWLIYSGDQVTAPRQEIKQHLIASHQSIVYVLAWCVINKVIDQQTGILLDYNTEPLREQELYVLIRNLSALFPPLRVNAIPRKQLLQQRKIEKCFAVVNFESSRLKADVHGIASMYETNWGERYMVFGRDEFDLLQHHMSEQSPLPERFVYVPESSHSERVLGDFFKKTTIAFDSL